MPVRVEASLPLVVTVLEELDVWLVSLLVVVSLDVLDSVTLLAPVISLPVSVVETDCTLVSLRLVVAVWLISVSTVLVVLELESLSV